MVGKVNTIDELMRMPAMPVKEVRFASGGSGKIPRRAGFVRRKVKPGHETLKGLVVLVGGRKKSEGDLRHRKEDEEESEDRDYGGSTRVGGGREAADAESRASSSPRRSSLIVRDRQGGESERSSARVSFRADTFDTQDKSLGGNGWESLAPEMERYRNSGARDNVAPSCSDAVARRASTGCMRIHTLEESLRSVPAFVFSSADDSDAELPLLDSEGCSEAAARRRMTWGSPHFSPPFLSSAYECSNKCHRNPPGSSSDTVDDDTSKTPPTVVQHSVHYGFVNIREYGRTLGDHPACSDGPPIALGWWYEEKASLSCPSSSSIEDDAKDDDAEFNAPITVDEYEMMRRQSRRPRSELLLPKETREELLLAQGYTHEEMDIVHRKKKMDQIQREATIARLKYMTLDESIETFAKFLDCLNAVLVPDEYEKYM